MHSPLESAGTIFAAAQSGNQEAMLIATRDRIAVTLDNPETPARDLASLSKRLMEISREIEKLQAAEEEEHGGGFDSREDIPFDPATV